MTALKTNGAGGPCYEVQLAPDHRYVAHILLNHDVGSTIQQASLHEGLQSTVLQLDEADAVGRALLNIARTGPDLGREGL